MFFGGVGLFLGNVGRVLGFVRHGAEEKFEVRVGGAVGERWCVTSCEYRH